MNRNKTYNTKQKEKILKIIKERDCEFTIKDIYKEVKSEIGLTTIYRFIDALLREGSIRKVIEKDNLIYYQYLEKCDHNNHFYLKCDKCKNMIHIDCDCIKDLSLHILDHHNFKTNNESIIINGICNKCINKGEEK